MRVFVTVGSTQFPSLTTAVLQPEVTEILAGMGFTHMVIQGGSCLPSVPTSCPLTVDCWAYKPSLAEDMASADLIISHAGAGTCLEVLELGKPLVVIVNSRLMGNHQVELAERLAQDGHLVYGDSDNVAQALLQYQEKAGSLQPYSPGDPAVFTGFLDSLMGVK